MAKKEQEPRVCDALYVAWRLEADVDSADSLQQLLTVGQSRNLYRLRCWMAACGEARALIVPHAPLEDIASALFTTAAEPLSTRWIRGISKCAAMTREIETVPVQMGLANRPEEWRYSSAFGD
jgi:hypothetical protein